MVGIEPDPRSLSEWPQIERWLAAAAVRSPEPAEILEPGEVLWTVRRFDGDPLPVAKVIAAATARLTETHVEVVLVGGVDAQSWVWPLTGKLAAWATDEGVGLVRAFGRRGWRRVLPWRVIGEDGAMVAYEWGSR